jgi:hypothetical protein
MVGATSCTFLVGILQISKELNILLQTLHETQDQLMDISNESIIA